MQCVRLGAGADAKEVTAEMFDTTKQKDIRYAYAECCLLLAAAAGCRSPRRCSHHRKNVAAHLWPPALPSCYPSFRQTKLRVVMLGPPKPPSPVPEGIEEPTSPATLAFRDAPSSAATTGLRDQLGAAQVRACAACAACQPTSHAGLRVLACCGVRLGVVACRLCMLSAGAPGCCVCALKRCNTVVVLLLQEDKAEIRKRLELLEDRSAAGGGRGGSSAMARQVHMQWGGGSKMAGGVSGSAQRPRRACCSGPVHAACCTNRLFSLLH